MNDLQLLERLAETDPCPGDAEMPASAWSPDVAFSEVEERVAVELPATRWPRLAAPRPGWLVAAMAFIVVLVVGGVLLAVLRDASGPDPVAPASSAPSPSTTAAPPTSAVREELLPEAQTLLANFEAAYNSADVETLAALIGPETSLTLTPSPGSDDSPITVPLVDHAAAAGLFDETISFGECAQLDAEIQCGVMVIDRFAETLELEPWIQSWTIEIDTGRVTRIETSGGSPARAAALVEFQQY
ncbi:MAG: hypothetical protein MJE66_24455, partial [Proteobacteria bacterium]|nr:hypothetical protein [Pseudomonadota bacterium]